MSLDMNGGLGKTGVERLAGIDGLRAIAMTMVIAQHSGLLPFGWVGVWLFFVISGYVITRGFLSEESSIRTGCPPRLATISFSKSCGFSIRPIVRTIRSCEP